MLIFKLKAKKILQYRPQRAMVLSVTRLQRD